MHSSVISKIEKARRYAEEPERFSIGSISARVRGDNDEHDVTLSAGAWHCNCDFFETHTICSHTMAMEKLLQGMVPTQRVPEPVGA